MNIWYWLFAGWGVAAAVMLVMWLVQLRTKDAGIVDVTWAFLIGVLAAGFAFVADGDPTRRWIIGGLALAWSVRLGTYLAGRVFGFPEDGRYQELRRLWGTSANRNLLIFFQVQATWAVLFAAPMLLAARNYAPLGWLDALGVGVWITAVAGELISDAQLNRFRKNPANKGQVCRDGLWRYSRHPNYFFEWLHWWAYVCLGWTGPEGWLTLIGPVTMLVFLFKITGIPPTEANALKSRGDAYREYQRTTSVFFPWPPKESAST